MVKKLVRFFGVIVTIVVVITSIMFYSIFISVKNLNINYENISSSSIPVELEDVQIGFISDIYYNAYMDESRLTSMMSTIKDTHPDIIIFGGDMFHHPGTNPISDADIALMITLLSNIDAPLGKFAVYGEHDLENEEEFKKIASILDRSGFEDITNKTIRIHNKSNASVTLSGLDCSINGNPDIENIASNINEKDFNIVVTHAADILDQLPLQIIDLSFAGHSRGGQISIPILGGLQKEDGAIKYASGTYQIGRGIIHVSNGLGTLHIDMRLFCPPEILIYRFIHSS